MASSIASIPPPASTSTLSNSTQFAAPQPVINKPSDFSGIFATKSPPPSQAQTGMSAMVHPPAQPKPTGYQPAGPNYFTSVSTTANTAQQPGTRSVSGFASPPVSTPGSIGSAAPKKSSGGDAFASLLSGSKIGAGKASAGGGLSMQDMAKQKTSAGLWGAPAASTTPTAGGSSAARPKPSGGGGALDDLLG